MKVTKIVGDMLLFKLVRKREEYALCFRRTFHEGCLFLVKVKYVVEIEGCQEQ